MTIATSGLGRVHTGVSPLEQVAVVFPVSRADARVNADAQSNSALADLGGRGKSRDDFVEHADHAHAIAGVDQNQPELVPSEARHCVDVAHAC